VRYGVGGLHGKHVKPLDLLNKDVEDGGVGSVMVKKERKTTGYAGEMKNWEGVSLL